MLKRVMICSKFLKKLPFYEQLNPKTLHVEYQFFLKCARDYIAELKKICSRTGKYIHFQKVHKGKWRKLSSFV